MRNYFVYLLFLLCSPALPGQTVTAKWWVTFTDKNQSPYCTCRPAEFLSARSLERRARAGIPVVDNDLPVNPAYVQGLRDKGARIHTLSKWLNAAAVIADSGTAQSLRTLPYVREVSYIGRDIRVKNPPNRPARKRSVATNIPVAGNNPMGYAARQNSMLGMPLLYAAGARGKGIWVGVMDGGFINADTMPVFDSVAIQGRLYQARDFVEHDSTVFESATHGTGVLSVMAGNLPGYFVGTAPEATYFLMKTEDIGGEYPVEESNWIAGAEWADSAGIDVINASLGYTAFNDTTLGHRPYELDGRHAIGARGATIAATKGMIICNSAGNSGDEDWRLVGVPADATGIVAVGSVNYDGQRSSFSSLGPTADGRIKPDLMAPGDRVVTAGYSGIELGLASGTSLASPMLAGSIASLWSAFPDRSGKEILDAIYATADQLEQPDNNRGYGLPDIARAWLHLGGYWPYAPNFAGNDVLWSYDKPTGQLSVLFLGQQPEEGLRVRVFDAIGREIKGTGVQVKNEGVTQLTITGLGKAKPGIYRVVLCDKTQTFDLRFVGTP